MRMFLTTSRKSDNPIGIITPGPVGILYVSMSSRKNRSATEKSEIKTRSLVGLRFESALTLEEKEEKEGRK